MTFLEAVNRVLTRLRENAVSSYDVNDYTRMVAQLVNEAKREVEDSHEWSALKTLIDGTIADTETDVTFSGTNQRTRIICLYDDTNNLRMTQIPRDRLIKWREWGSNQTGCPGWWAFKGYDAAGQVELELYPTSDGAYTLTLDCINPQSDLVSNNTMITIPPEPVALRATALALAERGDDQGQNFAQLMNEYQIALTDAVNRDQDNSMTHEAWITP